MKTKTIVVEMLSLSADKLSNCRLKQLAVFRWRESFTRQLVSASGAQFKHTFGTQHVAVMCWFSRFNNESPGHLAGFFVAGSRPMALAKMSPKLERRNPVESDTAHYHDYHDSESGDIYDLFNACNGIVLNGLLDVDQLNQYSPEEASELNITRLREVWKHTKTGCPQCQDIVKALCELRSRVGDIAPDIDSQDGPDTDTDPDISHITIS